MAFWESLGANAVLAIAYAAYKVMDRCMHSKCRYNKEGGFDFDLGDPAECPVADMANLGELLKQRSAHHLRVKELGVKNQTV